MTTYNTIIKLIPARNCLTQQHFPQSCINSSITMATSATTQTIRPLPGINDGLLENIHGKLLTLCYKNLEVVPLMALRNELRRELSNFHRSRKCFSYALENGSVKRAGIYYLDGIAATRAFEALRYDIERSALERTSPDWPLQAIPIITWACESLSTVSQIMQRRLSKQEPMQNMQILSLFSPRSSSASQNSPSSSSSSAQSLSWPTPWNATPRSSLNAEVPQMVARSQGHDMPAMYINEPEPRRTNPYGAIGQEREALRRQRSMPKSFPVTEWPDPVKNPDAYEWLRKRNERV